MIPPSHCFQAPVNPFKSNEATQPTPLTTFKAVIANHPLLTNVKLYSALLIALFILLVALVITAIRTTQVYPLLFMTSLLIIALSWGKRVADANKSQHKDESADLLPIEQSGNMISENYSSKVADPFDFADDDILDPARGDLKKSQMYLQAAMNLKDDG